MTGKLIDMMEKVGIVGPQTGAKPREVLIKKNIMRIIGIGELGGESVNKISKLEIPGVRTLVCNSHADVVLNKSFINGDADVFIIVADLSNDAVNDLALDVVKESKTDENITICILTLPYLYVGERNVCNSLKTSSIIQHLVDTCMILNKESYNKDPQSITFNQLLRKISDPINDTTIADIIHDLIDIILGFMNTPFVWDLVLKNSTTLAITKGYGMGKNRVSEAIKDALDSPLMDKCDLKSAKNIIWKIYTAQDIKLSQKDNDEVCEFISNFTYNSIAMYGDIGTAKLSNDEVSVTLLVSGFDPKLPK